MSILILCHCFPVFVAQVAVDLSEEARQQLSEEVESDVLHLGLRGIRSLAVAKTNQDGKWEFLGLLTFLDPPRPDTKQTIEDANRYGVAVKMITGDHILIAKETARLCNIQYVDIVRIFMFYVLLKLISLVGTECLAWGTTSSLRLVFRCWTP